MVLIGLIIVSFKVEGYWTYEFCRRQSVLKQYHEEVVMDESGASKGTVKETEYILGKKLLNVTDNRPPKMTIRSGDLSEGELGSMVVGEQRVSYYLERYIEGTVCDLTNERKCFGELLICILMWLLIVVF